MRFEYLGSIQALKVKFEQVTSDFANNLFDIMNLYTLSAPGSFLQSQDSSGTKSTSIVSDPRKRADERALEKEEQEYFDDRFIFYSLDIESIPFFCSVFPLYGNRFFLGGFSLNDEEDTASASMSRPQKTQAQPVRSNGVSPSSLPRYVLT